MADYISKEAVVDVIRYRVCQGQGNEEHRCKRGSCAYCGIMEIISNISEIPAADVQPVNQWISIDERLPQDGEEALVYAGNRGVMIGLYDSVLQVWLDYECCGLKVTHWQPLPEPPKKEG